MTVMDGLMLCMALREHLVGMARRRRLLLQEQPRMVESAAAADVVVVLMADMPCRVPRLVLGISKRKLRHQSRPWEEH